MEIFDEARLGSYADRLSAWKRVAFMAYCCERMLPNYQSFFAETGYGNASALRNALDAVWKWIETDHLPDDLSDLVAACDQQAPDTSEFRSTYTSAALDAATATATTLEGLGDVGKKQLVEVASFARDTIDLFVQERDSLNPNDPLLESKIIESGLMQAELRIQRASLETLASLEEERERAGQRLRAEWSHLKRGSLSGNG